MSSVDKKKATMSSETIFYTILLVVQVVGIKGTIISLGYLWLKLALDFHSKLMLTLMALQNVACLIISATSVSRMLVNQCRDFQNCAMLLWPLQSAFVGNLVYSFMISAIQFWTPCSQGKQELLTITVLCMIYGGHMCTYPQMVPRKRFIMKKAPTKISETK